MFDVPSCLAKDPDFFCGLPESFESDADIAGYGVFVAFAAAVTSSIVAVFAVLFVEFRELTNDGLLRDSDKRHKRFLHQMRMFLDAFLVGLSDAQAITSLAILIPAYFFLGCSTSAYHYDLVCNLVLMSTAAHIGSVVVLHRYFDSKWWLWVPRLVILAAILILSSLLVWKRTVIFPSFTPITSIPNVNTNGTLSTGLVLPAACFIDHPGLQNSSDYHNFTATTNWVTNATISHQTGNSTVARSLDLNTTFPSTFNSSTMTKFVSFDSNDTLGGQMDKELLIALFVFLGVKIIIVTIHTLSESMDDNDGYNKRNKNGPASLLQWIKFTIKCLTFLLATIIGIYGFIRFKKLQNWMTESSGWLANDDGETSVKSFGQLMPLLLLALPLLQVIEQIGPFLKLKKGYTPSR